MQLSSQLAVLGSADQSIASDLMQHELRCNFLQHGQARGRRGPDDNLLLLASTGLYSKLH